MIKIFLKINKKKFLKFRLNAAIKINIPSDHNERIVCVLQRAKELNLILLKYDVKSTHSYIYYICNNCNVENNNGVELREFLSRKPKCCENKNRLKPPGENLLVLLKERNHELVGAMPKSFKDSFTLRCLQHNQQNQTTFEKYKKAKYGITCCGNKEGAQKRIITGESLGRKNPAWRQDAKMRKWAKEVQKFGQKKCFFTEVTSPVQVHRLYSASKYPSLRYNILNGIVIHTLLHRTFHSYIGWKNDGSPEDFIEFILNCQNSTFLNKLFELNMIEDVDKLKSINFVNLDPKIGILQGTMNQLKQLLKSE